MNILHHKSWHVRNKDNIERVRRDEENARKEEEERLRKVALAESEARTSILRARAKDRQRDDDKDYEQATSQATTSRHINFFADEEQGIKKGGTNAEHEQEKKEEKEKQEKAIGLLTYLGQSAVEAQTVKPWYHSAPSRQRDESSSNQIEEFDSKKKRSLDPMHMMMKYVNTKRKIEGKDPEPPAKKFKSITKTNTQVVKKSTKLESDSSDSDTHKAQSKHKKKKKKHKHEKKKKHKKNKDKQSHKEKSHASAERVQQCESRTGSKTIEQLRAERLQREHAERQKTKQLLAKLRGETTQEERELEKTLDDRSRGYNSQFNPELARRPKKQQDWINMV